MQSHSFDPILCPVDFSEVSAHALRYADMLSRCGNARVIAAYANWFEAPPYFTKGRIAELQSEFRDSLGQAERTLADFVRSTLGDRSAGVETPVVEALPADGIRQLAAGTHAGLIVMGTHGRSGLNRWILGPVTEKILRESPVPVLTVRNAPKGPIRRILCPVSDTEESRSALAAAANFAACFDAAVTALHVHEGHGAGSIPNLCAWIPAQERSRCEIRELVRHGNAAEEIIKATTEGEYDLLVLGAARRRFFEGMVLGTTTLRAVRHAPCPVLSTGGAQAEAP
jgi:nucleotide-binding universal stress UspA family protein